MNDIQDISIETERLILKPMAGLDVNAHIDMMQHPEMAKYLTNEGVPRDRSTEWRAAASIIGHRHIRGFTFFSVFEKSSNQWVGRVGPWQPEGWPALEVGWAIAPKYWGRGYAPEAAIASMGWVFDQFPDLGAIISVINPENKNSQAVAKKIGETKSDQQFELWGYVLDIWKITREDWYKLYGS